MSDVHRRAAASAPRLTPEEVATRGFAAAFRGISELEVRNFLKRVAEELALARAREEELIALADDLRDQVKSPPIVTEDRLLDALGEETARVLRSAQESAEQIRARAEEKAHTTIADAEAAGAATREEADADAAAMRDAAQTAAAARENEASEYAEQLRATVDAEVEALRTATDTATEAMREESIAAASSEIEASKEAGRELVNEARAVRERILADLGRRRLLLQAQVDELRAGRDRLLDAYRVVKRTLGDATEALVQVETRAGLELSTPPEELNVSPVDGELEALAGHLTGEAGAPSVEVEALFARLRGHGGTPTSPEPDLTGDSDLPAPKPTTKPATTRKSGNSDTAKKSTRPTKKSESTDPEPQRRGDEQVGSVPSNTASTDSERTSNQDASTDSATDATRSAEHKQSTDPEP
ncbi:MAG: DivIVA domain-containing protein, partial [Acidimicrobiia bacterium]